MRSAEWGPAWKSSDRTGRTGQTEVREWFFLPGSWLGSGLGDGRRAVHEGAEPDGIVAALSAKNYLDREEADEVLVWVLGPGIIAKRPAKIARALAQGAVLNGFVPIGSHDIFVQ